MNMEYKHTDETKKKISQTKKNNPYVYTEKTKFKMKQAMKIRNTKTKIKACTVCLNEFQTSRNRGFCSKKCWNHNYWHTPVPPDPLPSLH